MQKGNKVNNFLPPFLLLVASVCHAQILPTSNGVGSMPDSWLLDTKVAPEWYSGKASPTPSTLETREPSQTEQQVIVQAQSLLSRTPAKAIALIDNGKVVYVGYAAPANADSLLHGFSIAKTLTAMAVGQAICANKLKMDTRADALIPELAGKALGTATVYDLLRMASGSKALNHDGTFQLTPEQLKVQNRPTNYLETLTEAKVADAEQGVFSPYKPGEHFVYKQTEPDVLGIMIHRATGQTYAEWMQSHVLDLMGEAETNVIMQDRFGEGEAAGGVKLHMGDWVRFAVWVQKASKEKGCFGDFVREANKTQIKNEVVQKQRRAGYFFSGYGYFMWTENEIAPNSSWAQGYGGQRIGWFKDSNRAVVFFSTADTWAAEAYALAKTWNHSH